MRIVVPIFDSSTVDVKSRRYNPASRSTAQKAPPPDREAPLSREQAAERLRRAVAGYETGSFDDSCEELDYLLQANVLAGGEKIVLIKYLGFCAVAYDDSEAAADYFRKWIELEPKASLDEF